MKDEISLKRAVVIYGELARPRLHEATTDQLDLCVALGLGTTANDSDYIETQIDAEATVLEKMRSGKLMSWGFPRGAPFSQGRVEIHSEQWQQLKPDFRGSLASLAGEVVLTGIVVAEAPAMLKTGGPGRPTSISLALAEYERRRDNSECCATVSEEARVLHKWFLLHHPKQPANTVRTIENRIREDFRKHRTKL